MTRMTPEARLESVVIASFASISEAMARLDKAGTGALVLCSGDRKLVGLLTDGDIRRAILKSWKLDDPCGSICTSEPITALEPIAPDEALRLMNLHDIDHLPVVDAGGVLHDLILRRDLGAEVGVEATAAATSRKRCYFSLHLNWRRSRPSGQGGHGGFGAVHERPDSLRPVDRR